MINEKCVTSDHVTWLDYPRTSHFPTIQRPGRVRSGHHAGGQDLNEGDEDGDSGVAI